MFAGMTARPAHHQFHAMGTTVDMWLWETENSVTRYVLKEAERIFENAEARFSRFRPESELSRLNRSAGRPFSASPELFRLVRLALAWRTRTAGLFDPTILTALANAGYDRSFEQLAWEPVTPPFQPLPESAAGFEIELNDWQQTITLPTDTAKIDLGGIAKSWTAQQALKYLAEYGAAMVDAGGDIVCTASPTPLNPWLVGVENPLHECTDCDALLIDNEAVATSSVARRQWTHYGAPAHHIIDPRTGQPAHTDLVSVTVVAPALPEAEIHAKVALIWGAEAGLSYLKQIPSLSAQLILHDGTRLTAGSFKGSLICLQKQAQNRQFPGSTSV